MIFKTSFEIRYQKDNIINVLISFQDFTTCVTCKMLAIIIATVMIYLPIPARSEYTSYLKVDAVILEEDTVNKINTSSVTECILSCKHSGACKRSAISIDGTICYHMPTILIQRRLDGIAVTIMNSQGRAST